MGSGVGVLVKVTGGDAVGLPVEGATGLLAGCVVGVSVIEGGVPVGKLVALTGPPVGSGDGSVLGTKVGLFVGFDIGRALGLPEGAMVGLTVGLGVGLGVGRRVGLLDGSPQALLSQSQGGFADISQMPCWIQLYAAEVRAKTLGVPKVAQPKPNETEPTWTPLFVTKGPPESPKQDPFS